MTIPLTNIINVSVTSTPQGLQVPSVNNIALFTTEAPDNVDDYRVYLEAKSVITDYGTNAKTAEFANLIFSQSPNILSGNGSLTIVPMQAAVSATQGDFTTDDISGNLANLIAIADGDIRVVLNGNNIDLTGLNFTNATTLENIAAIIQKKLTDVIVEAVGNTIKFTSKKVGLDSDVDVVQLPAGSGSDLSGASLLNVASGTATSGANSSGETILEALARVEEQTGFVGVFSNLQIEDAVVSSTATAIQAKNKMFIHHFSSSEDLEDTTGICSIIKDATQTKTRCLYYSVSPQEANKMKAAWVGRAFSVNFSGSNTSQTMFNKTLAGITPDVAINQTILTKAKDAGADIYGSVSGLGVTFSHGANDFFDNVYNQQWFKFTVEVSSFNYLRKTNTKKPQIESGMDGLKATIANNACEKAVNNGVIALGLTWNSAETFGNPEDFRRNITDKGYFIYSLPIAQQDQSEREARQAPLVQIAIKLAGALHSVNIIVNIER